MRYETALDILEAQDKQDNFVFHIRDLKRLFQYKENPAFYAALRNFVNKGLLKKAGRSIYVFSKTHQNETAILNKLVLAFRQGEYCYTSLETVLSEHGVISQMLLDRITVMTTGRAGTFKTPWGVIEYTHTSRNVLNFWQELRTGIQGLKEATVEIAWRDLKRVGRNVNMVDQEELTQWQQKV